MRLVLPVYSRVAVAAKQANQLHQPSPPQDGKKPKADQYGVTKFFPVVAIARKEDEDGSTIVQMPLSNQSAFRLAPGFSFDSIKQQIFNQVYDANVLRDMPLDTTASLYFLTPKKNGYGYDGQVLVRSSFQNGSADFMDFLKSKRTPLFGAILEQTMAPPPAPPLKRQRVIFHVIHSSSCNCLMFPPRL